jgi:hypothetical protein
LVQQVQASVEDLKKLFGETRGGWIDTGSADWVNMNPLFAGVATKLRKLKQQCSWYVVTRQQERFVKQILKANAIELADEWIFWV